MVKIDLNSPFFRSANVRTFTVNWDDACNKKNAINVILLHQSQGFILNEANMR